MRDCLSNSLSDPREDRSLHARLLGTIALITFTLCAISCGFAGETASVVLPQGRRITRVDFERHVLPVLHRQGCNAGSCHGAFSGRGGFRLSLFGDDAFADHQAITRHIASRRVNVFDPDRSLLLRKPSLSVSHQGGLRLRRGSWEYNLIRQWIADDAPISAGDHGVRELHAFPQRVVIDSTPAEVRVTASDEEGGREDVTPFCTFRSQDEAVASVDGNGKVQATGPGITAVVASYGKFHAVTQVIVPASKAQRIAWPKITTNNRVDREVFASLRELNIAPSYPADDYEFLRRLTLTTTGQLPTLQQIRDFQADKKLDKRSRAIDAQLSHPLYAAYWATRFSDITGNRIDALDGPAELRPKKAKMWHDWFRDRIARNVPYDQIVRGVLTATSREDASVKEWLHTEAARLRTADDSFATDYAHRRTLDLMWRRGNAQGNFPVEETAERIATAFMGVRIECAQCHRHPFDRWSQSDYRGFANVFTQVRFGQSPRLRSQMVDLLEERRRLIREGKNPPRLPRLEGMFLTDRVTDFKHPKSNAALPPRPLGGPQIETAGDRRAAFADWLLDASNPFFAKAIVNRVWAHYFGIGLVDPVDAFSPTNPASHPELLAWLADDFVKHGYDFRRLERMILTSQTWQLSSIPNESNRRSRRTFARMQVRPLPAEAAIDALHEAVGLPREFGDDVPPGVRAVEVAPDRVRQSRMQSLFRLFGRAPRVGTCDCERPANANVRQSLFLMCDESLVDSLPNGRLKALLTNSGLNDEQVIEQLYFATLSRPPSTAERAAIIKQLKDSESRSEGFTGVLWALINTREFFSIH